MGRVEVDVVRREGVELRGVAVRRAVVVGLVDVVGAEVAVGLVGVVVAAAMRTSHPEVVAAAVTSRLTGHGLGGSGLLCWL